MKKIPSLFQRDWSGSRLARDEVTPGCEWVVAGEGVATRKYDGTCCMVKDKKLYKRLEFKKGKPWPADFIHADGPDMQTSKIFGWVPVGDGPEDKWHREGFNQFGGNFTDGTYELVGPKIQGNPEFYAEHLLVPHGQQQVLNAPRTFNELAEFFTTVPWEGLVWHHPDGRMCKIKAKDFGIKR